MQIGRRQVLRLGSIAAAGLAVPGAFASTAENVRPRLLSEALAALDRHRNRIPHRDLIGLVDFSVSSANNRFYLLNLGTGRVASSFLVAHGRGSDPADRGWVERLSNMPDSNASCGGSFVTGATYVGKHGTSRRLLGLDPGNSMAAKRGIIIHAADYVGTGVALSKGRVGRSQRCFAVSPGNIGTVLARLGSGRLLFAMR